MSDKTKHVTHDAPRHLGKAIDLIGAMMGGGSGTFKVTRGTPIEKLPDPDHIEGEAVFAIVDKLNELIDRINAMNEVSPGLSGANA